MASLVAVIWIDVHRMYVVNNVDMSRLKAPWQNDTYKIKHTEQHKNTQNTKTQQIFRTNYFCVFLIVFIFFIYDFLNVFNNKSCLRKRCILCLAFNKTSVVRYANVALYMMQLLAHLAKCLPIDKNCLMWFICHMGYWLQGSAMFFVFVIMLSTYYSWIMFLIYHQVVIGLL